MHPKRLTLILTQLLIVVSLAQIAFTTSHMELFQNQPRPYVPRDLDDCFDQLEKTFPKDEIEKFGKAAEKQITDYHFGLGLWVRNNWGLWAGSRLARWFSSIGIHHPDDMSTIILTSFWRHLNSKPIRLEEQVRFYQDYWNKIKKQK